MTIKLTVLTLILSEDVPWAPHACDKLKYAKLKTKHYLLWFSPKTHTHTNTHPTGDLMQSMMQLKLHNLGSESIFRDLAYSQS